ncbi:MAG: hypothetical protein O6857_07015 [Nitrospinae bacterium]|nr:hypothetical protein [Nitrospinota bacterium]
MKSAKLIFLIVFSLFLVAFGLTDASAYYKKKVQVQMFQNAPGWVGTYNPGALMRDLLGQHLQQQENVVLVRFSDRKKNAPPRKPGKDPAFNDLAEIQTPAQIIVTGRILKYRPALPLKLESTRTEKKMARSAEIQIEFQIFQGQTKRLLTGFVLNQKSTGGEFPLGFSQSSLNLKSPDFKKTYMGRALARLSERVVPLITDYVNRVPLDGQVIAVEPKDEQLVINVGWKSGVEIRDEFVVYSVDVGFPDPLYKEDIGDRLNRLGVVRVINVQEGFSEVVIMAGGDFVKGNLVRSKKFKPLPKILKDAKFTSTPTFSQP